MRKGYWFVLALCLLLTGCSSGSESLKDGTGGLAKPLETSTPSDVSKGTFITESDIIVTTKRVDNLVPENSSVKSEDVAQEESDVPIEEVQTAGYNPSILVECDTYLYLPAVLTQSTATLNDYMLAMSLSPDTPFFKNNKECASDGYLSYDNTGLVSGNDVCQIIFAPVLVGTALVQQDPNNFLKSEFTVCGASLSTFSCGEKLDEYEDAYLYKSVYALTSGISTGVNGACVFILNKTTQTAWMGLYSVFTESDKAKDFDVVEMCKCATVSKSIKATLELPAQSSEEGDTLE